MQEKKLRKLRERAFRAGILGSSKLDEQELREALARTQRRTPLHSLFRIPSGRIG